MDIHRREDGVVFASSPLPLALVQSSLPRLFELSAKAWPERVFMRQRVAPAGPWREIHYGEALDRVRSIAQWLVDDGAVRGDVLTILSGPSIEHALLALGAQYGGMAVAPLSVGFSQLSKDFGKLRSCLVQCRPRYAYVDDADLFATPLHAAREVIPGLRVIHDRGSPQGSPLVTLLTHTATPAIDQVMNALGADDIARIMFTSGSTGSPKAVPQTQACMVQTVAQVEALGLLDFDGEGPQHLEAMPFSHIMAGNFNFNNVVRAGGTIHLDDGKPTPALFAHTLANLREVSPHFFITVPAGYAMLCDALEADADLCERFFRRLRYIGFGGAMLPVSVADRLRRLSLAARGQLAPILAFYGATEFLFGALQWWNSPRTDVIGLPPPGLGWKLAPVGNKLELRVQGATLMPRSGYLGNSDSTAVVFDEDGYYRTGDAVRWADPADPVQGLIFDGRIAEEFKLASGTWVSVAPLRAELLAACDPLVREAVICGLNREWPAVLLWLNESAARMRIGVAGAALTSYELVAAPAVREAIVERLRHHNAAAGGSSRRVQRALLVSEPLSYDANELTDKGTANQNAVRERRAADVERLFAADPDPAVLVF